MYIPDPKTAKFKTILTFQLTTFNTTFTTNIDI